MRDEIKAVFFRTTNQLSHSGRLGYANKNSVEQKKSYLLYQIGLLRDYLGKQNND
jgi:hypothetical protein